MKKLLFSAASMLLLLGSCSQNELEENVLSKGQNVVTATIEGQTNSRLAVEYNETANKFDLSWSAGDEFKVFNDDGDGVVYTWSSSNDFTASSTPSDPTYAVYPYTVSNSPSITGSTVTMTLSANPSVENINLPMWAGAPTNDNYAFKHLAAALRFTLNDIPAGYNQLIVTASKAISGEFIADLSASEPVLASAVEDDANKKVTVSFDAATTGTQNQVFYIPLPKGIYDLAVSVSDGTNTKELKSWTNLTVVRGKMYYTTATVDVASAGAVNAALENVTTTPTTVNLTAAIDASAGALDIPDAAENVTLNFEVAPTTSESDPLTINQNETALSGTATSELNVTMPAGATGLYATIDAPTTTVTLEGGSYSKVTATTATNTLIIKSGVNIETLTIEGGNVVIEAGANVASIVNNVTDNTITVNDAEGLKAAVAAGGNVILNANVTLDEILVVTNNLVLDGGYYTIESTATRAMNLDVGASNVTIKNLTVNAAERAFNIINSAKTVVIQNVTATANNNAIMVATSAEDVVLTIKESSLNGLATLNVAGPNAQVVIENSEFICNDADPGENYGAITIWSSGVGANVVMTGGNVVVAGDSKAGYVFPSNASLTFNETAGDIAIGYINFTIGDAGYEDLQEAFDDVESGQTIFMQRDYVISETVTVEEEKTFTFDLNDKTINVDATDNATVCTDIKNYGTMTIKNGKIVAASKENARRCIYNYGEMIVEDVEFTQTYARKGAAINNEGTLTINSATVNAVYYSIWTSGANAKTTVKNGTFKTTNDVTIRDTWAYTVNVLNGAKLVVDDGVFEGNHGVISVYGGSKATLNKGTFYCSAEYTGNSDWALYANGSASTINYNATKCTIKNDNPSGVQMTEDGGTIEEM